MAAGLDLFPILFFNSLSEVSILILIGSGLAIIFGMMRIINLAQGELLMIGAYVVLVSYNTGLGIWTGIVLAPVVVGAIGIVIERVLVRHLYKRPQDTLLATWGLSLALVQIVTLIFGTATSNPPNPLLGSINLGTVNFPLYRLFLVSATLGILAGTYLFFTRTNFGLKARAVMQNPSMAEALGIDTSTVYSITFAIGSGLAGAAGALLAPLLAVIPTMGGEFIARMFTTVIVGGVGIFTGLLGSSVLLGGISSNVSFLSTAFFGQVALLATASLILRILPEGLTGYVRR